MADTPRSRLATRLSFLIAGVGLSSWAPLVPYAKSRVGADDATLGMLLLCLGIGSVVAMPLAGGLSGRVGSRIVILLAACGLLVGLPILAWAPTMPLLVPGLLLFGASVGAIDVAVNIQGSEVQEAAGVPLMSNFHGMYSVGGLAGSAGMAAVLSAGVPPLVAALVSSAVIFVCLVIAAPRLLRTKSASDTPFFVKPHGIVLLIGLMAFSMFLVEGAMLDWSAVLLRDHRGVPMERAGIGYVLFSLAMTIGRLTGDRFTKWLSETRILLFGSLLAAAGIAIIVSMPWMPLALSGFVIIGFGASNVVPVLFTAAGRQKVMPPDLAIASVSALGYTGVLAGPASIGLVSKGIGLPGAFVVLACLAIFVACLHRSVRPR